MPPIKHFLLIYDVNTGALRHQDYDDPEEAAAAYAQAESEYRKRDGNYEIVLVGAENLDTIRQTHAQYFQHGDPFAELIAG